MPRIDWRNPLTNALAFAWVTQPSALQIDLVDHGNIAAWSTTAPTFGAWGVQLINTAGAGWRFLTGGNVMTTSRPADGLGDFTLMIIANPISEANGSNAFFQSANDRAFTTPQCGIDFNTDQTSTSVSGVWSSNVYDGTSSYALTAPAGAGWGMDGQHHVYGSIRSSGGTVFNLIFDGRPVTGTANNAGTIQVDVRNWNVGIGCYGDENGTGIGSPQAFVGGFMWNRALSPGEYAAFARDPFQFLIWPADDVQARMFGGMVSLSLGLTGAAAAAGAGSFLPTISFGLPGSAAASAAGALIAAVRPTVTGAAATSAAGTGFSFSDTFTLTGAAAGSGIGSFAATVAITLPGTPGASAAGVLGGWPNPTLTGIQETASAGNFAPTVAFTLPGNARTALAGTFAITSAESFGLTGAAAAGAAGPLVAAVVPVITGAGVSALAGLMTPGVGFTLPGSAVTGAAGLLAITIARALIGAAAAGAAGTFTKTVTATLPGTNTVSNAGLISTPAGINFLLPGALATGAAGAFAKSVAFTLAGAGAASAIGVLAAPVRPAIIGVGLSSAAGAFVATVTFALGGAASTAAAGSLARPVTIALPGIAGYTAIGNLMIGLVQAVIGGAGVAASAGRLVTFPLPVFPGIGVISSAGVMTVPGAASDFAIDGILIRTATGTMRISLIDGPQYKLNGPRRLILVPQARVRAIGHRGRLN